jgi:hypothetical protein
MAQSNETGAKTYQRERKYRRFDLMYPVHLKVQLGTIASELDAMSRNVSLGGLLVETTSPIPPESLVSFVVTLKGGGMVHPVELTGEGEVVRVQPAGIGGGFAIAVECKNPITQIERYLPASNG